MATKTGSGIGRSADTGRFMTVKKARDNPKTSIVHRVHPAAKPKKR